MIPKDVASNSSSRSVSHGGPVSSSPSSDVRIRCSARSPSRARRRVGRPGRRLRTLLALLAAACRGSVTVPALIDEIWGEELPRAPRRRAAGAGQPAPARGPATGDAAADRPDRRDLPPRRAPRRRRPAPLPRRRRRAPSPPTPRATRSSSTADGRSRRGAASRSPGTGGPAPRGRAGPRRQDRRLRVVERLGATLLGPRPARRGRRARRADPRRRPRRASASPSSPPTGLHRAGPHRARPSTILTATRRYLRDEYDVEPVAELDDLTLRAARTPPRAGQAAPHARRPRRRSSPTSARCSRPPRRARSPDHRRGRHRQDRAAARRPPRGVDARGGRRRRLLRRRRAAVDGVGRGARRARRRPRSPRGSPPPAARCSTGSPPGPVRCC